MENTKFSFTIESDPELIDRDYIELRIRRFIEEFCSDAEMELKQFRVED